MSSRFFGAGAAHERVIDGKAQGERDEPRVGVERVEEAGVGDVTFLGARDYSMRVWLDPDKLASREMTATDVLGSLREQNVQVAAGRIGQPPAPTGVNFQYPINAQGRLLEPEQFGDIIVKTGKAGEVTRLRDVKMLKGVLLPSLGGSGSELDVVLTADEGAPLTAQLRSQEGAWLHYSAMIDVAPELGPPMTVPLLPALEPYPMPRGGLYQDHLFHGPLFRLIDQVEGVSSRAMVAKVRGLASAGWPACRSSATPRRTLRSRSSSAPSSSGSASACSSS